jgi:hypothetical protein
MAGPSREPPSRVVAYYFSPFTFHFSPDRNRVYRNPLAPGPSPALSGVGIVPPFYEPVKLWFGRLQ